MYTRCGGPNVASREESLGQITEKKIPFRYRVFLLHFRSPSLFHILYVWRALMQRCPSSKERGYETPHNVHTDVMRIPECEITSPSTPSPDLVISLSATVYFSPRCSKNLQ